jgi:hypothetical protein
MRAKIGLRSEFGKKCARGVQDKGGYRTTVFAKKFCVSHRHLISLSRTHYYAAISSLSLAHITIHYSKCAVCRNWYISTSTVDITNTHTTVTGQQNYIEA